MHVEVWLHTYHIPVLVPPSSSFKGEGRKGGKDMMGAEKVEQHGGELLKLQEL